MIIPDIEGQSRSSMFIPPILVLVGLKLNGDYRHVEVI